MRRARKLALCAKEYGIKVNVLKNVNENPKLTQYLVANKLIHLNVVDIGARGGFADYWDYYRGCLDIIGFDPDSQQEKLSCGKCRARALSGDGKERIFYVIRYPGSSGFYPPNIDFTNRLRNRDYLNIIGTAEIRTITLDSLNLTPDFIKLDTEGSELEILEGGLETLRGTLGISIEMAFTELFKGQPLFREVDAFLAAQGFTLYDLETYRLDRVHPNKTGMSNGDEGQVIIGQGLYFRDIYKQLDNYTDETILKLASLFELFKLNDCAFEILNNPRTEGYLQFIAE